MATAFLSTGSKVTPENKGGPRVGVGVHVRARRGTPGAIGVTIVRGNGGTPEQFDYAVRTVWVGPLEANEVADIKFSAMDLGLTDFDPRSYRARISTDGDTTLVVTRAYIATEPYAVAGEYP